MTRMEQNLIPTLDWNYGVKSYVGSSFIKELNYAFSTYGFFLLKNHGINLELIAQAEKAFRDFFLTLNLEERMQYCYPETGYQIGYTPPRLEKGEFAQTPDEKHFFHVFPEDMPLVKELPTFNNNVVDLWWEFNRLARALMESIALSLGNTQINYFYTKEMGYSIVRGIHYPANSIVSNDDEKVTHGGNLVGMCASKHTDINMITLLLAREAGLQLWHGNTWVPITISDPNVIIVNAGDMLQHTTNGFYKSGLHRVVCTPGVERFSIPYFHHVPANFDISPIKFFGEPKPEYGFKTAGEFLNHRLRQLGLIV